MRQVSARQTRVGRDDVADDEGRVAHSGTVTKFGTNSIFSSSDRLETVIGRRTCDEAADTQALNRTAKKRILRVQKELSAT